MKDRAIQLQCNKEGRSRNPMKEGAKEHRVSEAQNDRDRSRRAYSPASCLTSFKQSRCQSGFLAGCPSGGFSTRRRVLHQAGESAERRDDGLGRRHDTLPRHATGVSTSEHLCCTGELQLIRL